MVVVAAVLSTGLMWWVGRRNPSLLLMALFTGWVLAPFVALLVLAAPARVWSERFRRALPSLMVAIAGISVGLYADVVIRPPAATPAFRFLVTPMASWALIAIALVIEWRTAPGRSR